MLQRPILSALARAERGLRLPGSMDYLRVVARHSTAGFAKFMAFLPLAGHRGGLPLAAWFAARLAATRSEDCGTCVQVVVNDALNRGVPPRLVRDLVDERWETVPEELARVYHFAYAVAGRLPRAEELREPVRARYGDGGLVELAMAIAAARVFPTAKRALGLAQSCSRVRVEVPG